MRGCGILEVMVVESKTGHRPARAVAACGRQLVPPSCLLGLPFTSWKYAKDVHRYDSYQEQRTHLMRTSRYMASPHRTHTNPHQHSNAVTPPLPRSKKSRSSARDPTLASTVVPCSARDTTTLSLALASTLTDRLPDSRQIQDETRGTTTEARLGDGRDGALGRAGTR